MSTPGRASTSASLPTTASRSRRASWRPTALLPEPIGPTRNTFIDAPLTSLDESQAAARPAPDSQISPDESQAAVRPAPDSQISPDESQAAVRPAPDLQTS